jgi:hypothetical protein
MDCAIPSGSLPRDQQSERGRINEKQTQREAPGLSLA